MRHGQSSACRRPGVSPGNASVLMLALLAACGANDGETRGGDTRGSEALPTAASLGSEPVASVAEYLASEPYATADRERGARLGRICAACHTFGAGEPNLLGPNLHGMFGRAAGAVDSYDYSDAFRETSFVWTPRAMDAWLAQPAKFLPGNRMSFVGVGEPRDRADLVAWLLEATRDH